MTKSKEAMKNVEDNVAKTSILNLTVFILFHFHFVYTYFISFDHLV